jgi:hypothetical protein
MPQRAERWIASSLSLLAMTNYAVRSNNCRISVVIRPVGDAI